jgi:hypothetical protein
MKKILRILFFTIIFAEVAVPAPHSITPNHIALTLQHEGRHRSAAIEWRRLALQADEPSHQAGYYWAAAYQYLQDNDPAISEKMLDAAEEAWWSIENAALILRADTAQQRADHSTAAFHWASIKRTDATPAKTRLAHRKLATFAVQSGNLRDARDLLEASPFQEEHALQALAQFEQGRDKSPRLGGLLGMIPGLGYAYAGEYANAFRSLILNSIFIYGMIDTARNDHWGAFGVITFFELTWYSGSIYGGIDASHRHNQRRRQHLNDEIIGNARFAPDWSAIPQITLEFTF